MNDARRSSAAQAVLVREARAADACVIAGFNRAIARETEGRDLAPHTVRDGVAAVMADPSLGFYRVAELDTRVVGALLVTYEWSDWRNGRFWWIQSVYVSPEARGLGVYRALHGQVRREALEQGGVCGIRLYVEKSNRRAQNAYASLGMQATDYHLYEQEF
jgi:ribosomal protein S18 acetylase RimI-like enzyme